MKKMTILAAACVLATCITGCGCQKQEPVEEPGLAQTDAAVATTEAVAETTGNTLAVEITEAAAVPAETEKAAETTAPTEEDLWELVPTEEALPPIEITVPDETQPYTDYEHYMDMSGEEQEAFFDSFENDEAFFAWFNQAKADYEAAHPPIIIDGNTNIEIKP